MVDSATNHSGSTICQLNPLRQMQIQSEELSDYIQNLWANLQANKGLLHDLIRDQNKSCPTVEPHHLELILSNNSKNLDQYQKEIESGKQLQTQELMSKQIELAVQKSKTETYQEFEQKVQENLRDLDQVDRKLAEKQTISNQIKLQIQQYKKDKSTDTLSLTKNNLDLLVKQENVKQVMQKYAKEVHMKRDHNEMLEKWLKNTNRSMNLNNSRPTRKLAARKPQFSLDLNISGAYYENSSSEEDIEPANFPIRFRPSKPASRPLSLPTIDLTRIQSPVQSTQQHKRTVAQARRTRWQTKMQNKIDSMQLQHSNARRTIDDLSIQVLKIKTENSALDTQNTEMIKHMGKIKARLKRYSSQQKLDNQITIHIAKAIH